jgi:hypothetical protein
MNKLGNFQYPTLRTFKEALTMTQVTLEKYAGVMPVIDAAKSLGYSVKDPDAISGTIYKQFNDICMYGLLTRKGVRGALKATPLAKEALDPFSTGKAAMAKAKALRSIELIDRAYSTWNGQLPDIAALPARLNELTGADWTECKNQAANIKNLLAEAFSYIQTSNEGGSPSFAPSESDRRDNMMKTEPTSPASPLSSQLPTGKATGTEEYVLGEGIRIYLPKENRQASWEKAKKAMKILVEEDVNQETP